MDRLLMQFHEPTIFRGSPALERREALGKCSLLLAAGWESIDSEPPGSQRMEEASPSFSSRPLPAALWSALAVEMSRAGGMLGIFPTWENAVTQTFKFPRTSRWMILLFPQTGIVRRKT